MKNLVIEQPTRTRDIVCGQYVDLIEVDGDTAPYLVIGVLSDRIIINYKNTSKLIHNSSIETAIKWEVK